MQLPNQLPNQLLFNRSSIRNRSCLRSLSPLIVCPATPPPLAPPVPPVVGYRPDVPRPSFVCLEQLQMSCALRHGTAVGASDGGQNSSGGDDGAALSAGGDVKMVAPCKEAQSVIQAKWEWLQRARSSTIGFVAGTGARGQSYMDALQKRIDEFVKLHPSYAELQPNVSAKDADGGDGAGGAGGGRSSDAVQTTQPLTATRLTDTSSWTPQFLETVGGIMSRGSSWTPQFLEAVARLPADVTMAPSHAVAATAAGPKPIVANWNHIPDSLRPMLDMQSLSNKASLARTTPEKQIQFLRRYEEYLAQRKQSATRRADPGFLPPSTGASIAHSLRPMPLVVSTGPVSAGAGAGSGAATAPEAISASCRSNWEPYVTDASTSAIPISFQSNWKRDIVLGRAGLAAAAAASASTHRSAAAPSTSSSSPSAAGPASFADGISASAASAASAAPAPFQAPPPRMLFREASAEAMNAVGRASPMTYDQIVGDTDGMVGGAKVVSPWSALTPLQTSRFVPLSRFTAPFGSSVIETIGDATNLGNVLRWLLRPRDGENASQAEARARDMVDSVRTVADLNALAEKRDDGNLLDACALGRRHSVRDIATSKTRPRSDIHQSARASFDSRATSVSPPRYAHIW